MLKNLQLVIARSPKDDEAICKSLSYIYPDCFTPLSAGIRNDITGFSTNPEAGMTDMQNYSYCIYLCSEMIELADEDVRQPQGYLCGWCTSSYTNMKRPDQRYCIFRM